MGKCRAAKEDAPAARMTWHCSLPPARACSSVSTISIWLAVVEAVGGGGIPWGFPGWGQGRASSTAGRAATGRELQEPLQGRGESLCVVAVPEGGEFMRTEGERLCVEIPGFPQAEITVRAVFGYGKVRA